MLSRFSPTVLLIVVLATVSGCMNCEYLGWHPIVTAPTGQKLCARHHIPLVIVHGYQRCGSEIVLYHFHGQSNIMDYCNPNHIDPHQSLVRTKTYCKPSLVTYCTLCEAAWQKHWNSPDRERPASWWQQMRTNIHLIPQ